LPQHAHIQMGQTGQTGRTARLSRRPARAGREPPPRHALDPDILDLDLEPVSFLVALEQPWPLEKLDATELEYRCFLQLVRDRPGENIVPSRDCDTYWHAHILTLGLYLKHCRRLFGHPLLHYPFSGVLGEEDAARQRARFRRSQRLQSDLMNRVLRTHHGDTTGDDHDTGNHQIPQPSGHLGAVQGA
jgi:hypothetical protein